MLKILEKAFLQALQKNSYCNIGNLPHLLLRCLGLARAETNRVSLRLGLWGEADAAQKVLVSGI